jgi:hypothetical protein
MQQQMPDRCNGHEARIPWRRYCVYHVRPDGDIRPVYGRCRQRTQYPSLHSTPGHDSDLCNYVEFLRCRIDLANDLCCLRDFQPYFCLASGQCVLNSSSLLGASEADQLVAFDHRREADPRPYESSSPGCRLP